MKVRDQFIYFRIIERSFGKKNTFYSTFATGLHE